MNKSLEVLMDKFKQKDFRDMSSVSEQERLVDLWKVPPLQPWERTM